MLLKTLIFLIVGALTGFSHYCLLGQRGSSLWVGLLAGLGGVAYVEFDAYRNNKHR